MFILLSDKLKLKLSILILITIISCSHSKPVNIPLNSNPDEEISRLEEEQSSNYEKQVNIIAPTFFKKSDQALKEAKERRAKGKDPEDVIKKISESQSNLRKAEMVAKSAAPYLGGVLESRNKAIEEGAPKYLHSEFSKVDEDFTKVGEKVEEGDFSDAQKTYGNFKNRYMDLELRAIKAKHLGPALVLVDQAKKEGAKKVSPQTLQFTEQLMTETDAYITANRNEKDEIQKRGDLALAKAERLVRITRESKNANQVGTEKLVLETEAYAQAMNDYKKAAEQMSTQLDSDKLKQGEKERFSFVYSLFRPEEAEIFEQGNKLTLRLKGMHFSTGKHYIPEKDFGLLNRVKTVLKRVGESNVTVQGHTDASGSLAFNTQLSQKRADTVRKYLMSSPEGERIPATIQPIGVGYTQPIASEKTTQGRSMNRRVDIVIEPLTSQ